MVCYNPLVGYYSKEINPSGKRGITFNKMTSLTGEPIKLPCGQCSGCRLERSRQWATRCMHEASQHDHNCFITLTYDDDHLPTDRSLRPKDFQLFMKRYRKKFGANIRFYHCGEYGDLHGRPHYHACIFNHDFHDKTLWRQSRENPLYRSKDLEKLWTYGYSSIGKVTFQSAAYVARYIMKKRLGKNATDHYDYVDPDGVVHTRVPEYTTMSRRPGIGANWVTAFIEDVYPDDFIIVNGKKTRPPKYYDTQHELHSPEDHRQITKNRKRNARKHKENNTPQRLKVRETIQDLKTSQLKRNLEQ